MLVVFSSPVLSSLFLGAESLTLTQPSEAFSPAVLQFYLGIMAPSPGRWSLNVLAAALQPPQTRFPGLCSSFVLEMCLWNDCSFMHFVRQLLFHCFLQHGSPNTKSLVRWVQLLRRDANLFQPSS